MNNRLDQIQNAIEPLKQQIIHHKIYEAIHDPEDLKIFMQYHVYAVWDFMSLLKSLQKNLTCTSVPWFPKGTPETRHLINEIVLGEESDIDHLGNRKSHFELYLDAMKQCGADTFQIKKFINTLKETGNFALAYTVSETPEEAREFLNFTFKIIETNKDYLQSAIFTFGREDLIPSMFHSIVNDIDQKFPDSISIFKYYLDRHIEIDGDHHSHLALEMTSSLCGSKNEYWNEAEKVSLEALQKRIDLWDGAYRKIMHNRNSGTLVASLIQENL